MQMLVPAAFGIWMKRMPDRFTTSGKTATPVYALTPSHRRGQYLRVTREIPCLIGPEKTPSLPWFPRRGSSVGIRHEIDSLNRHPVTTPDTLRTYDMNSCAPKVMHDDLPPSLCEDLDIHQIMSCSQIDPRNLHGDSRMTLGNGGEA